MHSGKKKKNRNKQQIQCKRGDENTVQDFREHTCTEETTMNSENDMYVKTMINNK